MAGNWVAGFPLVAWTHRPLKEDGDGRDVQEVRSGLQGGRGPASPGGREAAASRHWHLSLNLSKALGGAAPGAVARDRATSINPAMFDAAVLVITASAQQYAFPGVPVNPDRRAGPLLPTRNAFNILPSNGPGLADMLRV